MKSPKKKSVLGRISPIKSVSDSLTALFYGRSGTGKTTLAGSFPKPILILDIKERGTDSLIGESGISSVVLSSWSDYEEVYWGLKNGELDYKTVVIDSLHSLQSLALDEVKLRSGKKLSDQTSQRDFGQAGGLLNTWNFNYRDLQEDGINIVFIAHDKVNETEADETDHGMITPEVGPRLMPSVASFINGAVNLIGNTFIREEVGKRVAGKKTPRKIEYCLRIGPNNYYITKVRRPKKFPVPEYISDPTYDKLMDIINGKTGDSVKTQKTKFRRK